MFKLLLATAFTGITTTLIAAPQAKPATNTICPVAGDKVTAKSKTVAVRGQEYRICCAGCDKKLLAEPDKYLNKDGTPKNAPKAAK
jgi:YHS domain-containing protein